jgi:hypothetical protein
VSQADRSDLVSIPDTNSTRDRANLRLADVENSGRADIIWLNKYTGEAKVFKNNGYAGPDGGGSGSSFSWTVRGVLYSPIDRGEVMVSAVRWALDAATGTLTRLLELCKSGRNRSSRFDPAVPHHQRGKDAQGCSCSPRAC